MAKDHRDAGGDVLEKTKTKLREPELFKVLLHNDDYTTMEFVVHVLENVFNKASADAYRLMMQVHRQGLAVCGTYTYEVAETKVAQVHELARANGFPLRASLEEA